MTSYVYILQDDDEVKVGFSDSPKQRLIQIRMERNAPVTLVHQVECRNRREARYIESWTHWRLRKHRLGYEWFKTSPAKAIEAISAAIADTYAVRRGWIADEIGLAKAEDRRAFYNKLQGPNHPLIFLNQRKAMVSDFLPC